MAESPSTRTRRRSVKLQSIDDLVAEVNRIVDANSRGCISTTGSWTPAQILEHVAKLIEFSYDGFPFRASWSERVVTHIGKWLAWKQMIRRAFQPGYSLRSGAQALLPSPEASFDSAAARLRAALVRIQNSEPMRKPSPFEGRLTHEQWVYVHLRHAELHLSFIQFPGENPTRR